MKSKFLLIPTAILLVTGLIGCQVRKQREVEPYYLDTWLNIAELRKANDPNHPTGTVALDKEHSVCFDDADLTFRNKIQEVVKPLSLTPKKVDKEVKNTEDRLVYYHITAYLDNFDTCIMYINADGTISTNAYAGGWGAPKEQHYIYDIGKDATKEIIDFAVATFITQE